MRKWMRERLQRRKKKAPEETAQPTPPPLQPAYFLEEQPARLSESARDEEEAPASREITAGAPSAEDSASGAELESQSSQGQSGRDQSSRDHSGAKPPASKEARGRSRRRRGGRGRGGRGREQAVAQAFAPAAGKGIIPATESAAEMPESEEPEAEAATPAPQAPAAPSAVPVAPARPPKGIVVLAIGLPGSGKSSWFKRHNVVPLSSDILRSLLFDDVREQRFQDLVFSNLRSMLKARLIAKRPMNYVDATNLTPQERQHWIKLAKDYNYEVHAVFFDVPLEVCLERHQRRDRVVPEDVMRRMAAKLKPPSFNEGFAKITVVRVKKKEE
jgi:predicted kinase